MGSERGIAMIWWVIVLLVLFLCSAGLAYDRYSFAEQKVEEIAKLKVKLKASDREIQRQIQRRQGLSEFVGFKQDEGSMESSVEAIRDAIEVYKGKYQDPGQDTADRTLEDILKRQDRRLSATTRRLAAAETERDKARSDEDAARESSANVVRGKEQRIQELSNEKQQVEDRLTNTTNTKDQEIEALRTKVNALQEEKATLVAQHKKVVKDLKTQLDRQTNLAKEAARHYASLRRNNNADGRVLARTPGSNKVMVNVGARHGLKEGTQFEVYELVKGNRIAPKGRIVIQEIHADYARAAIVTELDEYNRIATGDLIRNPLFEAGQKPRFFLMGDMTGRLSNQETEALIRKMGGEVVKRVTVDTDFVVLGRKESENAPPLESREDYTLAKLFNIEIINSSYLIDYLTN